MSKKIILTLEEIGLGTRAALKQFTKPMYKAQGKNNRLENHLCGKLGEIAYSKITRHKINLEHFENSGDGGLDADDGAQIKTVCWTGPNKQIKVSRKEYEASLVNPKIKKFVLMFMDPKKGGEEIELIGWISKEVFSKNYHTESKWGEDLLLIDENQLECYYKD